MAYKHNPFLLSLMGLTLACGEGNLDLEAEGRYSGAGDCTDGIDNDNDGYLDCEEALCQRWSECDEDDTGADDTGVEDIEESMTVSVSWGDTELTLELTNADVAESYSLGIAENVGDCLSSEWGCWTGEDCHMGFDLNNDNGNLSYCHPLESDSISLAYGATPDDVVEGVTTVFGNNSFETLVTYVLDQVSSVEEETCWVWGADTNYYNGFYKSCIAMQVGQAYY